jgi:hypothetical protein
MTIVLPKRLTLVFDVESDPPQLLGTHDGEGESVVYYIDSRGIPGHAPADCVSVVSYDAVAAIGPGPATFQSESSPAESATSLITDDDEIDALRRQSRPLPGRDGVRQDEQGRVWYSARWLGLKS